MIPFSPPHIRQEVIDEVTAVLKSGWITTGPKTKEFERRLSAYCGNKATVCLNSATAGLELMLRWFGVGQGDEVILPAYTYSATANVVVHCGAKPVFVDVNESDFNISIAAIKAAITNKTKVIMPVDFAGLPCDYNSINELVRTTAHLFVAENERQNKLGRIMVLADAAHSIGARYQGQRTGVHADATVFSFHAVKNLTTAEGGAIALNLPEPFNNDEEYFHLCVTALHGQNKDALAKMQKGNWKYDIIEAGYKCNMTDIMAAIGLVELSRYEEETLPIRKKIIERYQQAFSHYSWAQLPLVEDAHRVSSFHLYPLRINGINEGLRDAIIQDVFNRDVSVNVHFIPLPLLSFYKKMGYSIDEYPITYRNFSAEISLPVFEDLTVEMQDVVIKAVVDSVQHQITHIDSLSSKNFSK